MAATDAVIGSVNQGMYVVCNMINLFWGLALLRLELLLMVQQSSAYLTLIYSVVC